LCLQNKTKNTNDREHENTEILNTESKHNMVTTPITLYYFIKKDKEIYRVNSNIEGKITDIANGYYVIAVGENNLYKLKNAVDNKLKKVKEKREKKGEQFEKTEFIISEKVSIRINKDFSSTEQQFTILPL
jgi:hypothetical protein